MMRTSASQFQLLVEYMERNGDLSKPTEGPHGRTTNVQRWVELTDILNADATGDTKTTEKWRKAWSDMKNNAKKKAARIHRAARGTGGGPACSIKLTDLEERVLSIIGTQAATGIVEIPEVGLEVEAIEPPPDTSDSPSIILAVHEQETCSTVEDWNRPGASKEPPRFAPSSAAERLPSRLQETDLHSHHTEDRSERGPAGSNVPRAARTPLPSTLPPVSARNRTQQSPTPLPLTPRRRRRGREHPSPLHRRTRTQTQSDLARQAFVRSDCEWRAFQQETERERRRLQELELRTQERWRDLFGQFLVLGNRIVDILEKK